MAGRCGSSTMTTSADAKAQDTAGGHRPAGRVSRRVLRLRADCRGLSLRGKRGPAKRLCWSPISAAARPISPRSASVPRRRSRPDRADDILANAGVHIGGTDFDSLFSLNAVMPMLGLGTQSGREEPADADGDSTSRCRPGRRSISAIRRATNAKIAELLAGARDAEAGRASAEGRPKAPVGASHRALRWSRGKWR